MPGLNDIYGETSTLPTSDLIAVENQPEANTISAGPANFLASLPSALEPVSFPPTELGDVEGFPMICWVWPEADVNFINIRIAGTAGAMINELTGVSTAFDDNLVMSVPVVPERWQRVVIAANSPQAITKIRFQSIGKPVGQLVPLLDGSPTEEFVININYRILDFRVFSGVSFSYIQFDRAVVDGIAIDKMIIALARGEKSDGTLVYNGTSESADSFRSAEAAEALTTLLSRGWTITR